MSLDRVLWGNTLSAWLVASGILVLAMSVLWVIERFALNRFDTFARSTQTDIDDLFSAVLGRTKLFLLFVVAVFFASLSLSLPMLVALVLRRAAAIAVVLQGGVWVSAAITFWVDRFRERTLEEDAAAVTTVSALSFGGRLAVWAVVLLIILDNLGVEVTALLTTLGIGGIAVALAVQNILGDLFASLSIVLDKPFVIGDFLSVGDYKGSVEYIGLKTTRLRSLSGEQLVISNGDLLKSRIRNHGRMGDRRAVFTTGVTYDTPREALERIPIMIREIVESQENTRFDRSHLIEFGDYAILFETVYYVTVPEYQVYRDIQQAVNLEIHRGFEEGGIEFAYPTQVVYTGPLGPGQAPDSRAEMRS
jgi:small-conductance mechanosensitive channel